MLKGIDVEQIKYEAKNLKDLILSWNSFNKVNFVQIPLAPTLVPLRGNDFPSQMNRGGELLDFNKFLQGLNTRNAPTMNDKGFYRARNGEAKHSRECWREKNMRKGLHLHNRVRGKIWWEVEAFFVSSDFFDPVFSFQGTVSVFDIAL